MEEICHGSVSDALTPHLQDRVPRWTPAGRDPFQAASKKGLLIGRTPRLATKLAGAGSLRQMDLRIVAPEPSR